MKKFFTFMLALIAAFVLIACDDDDITDVINVESVSLETINTNVSVGETINFSTIVKVTPSNATVKTVKINSSNESVATAKNSVVTFVAPGEVTITVTSVADATKKVSVTFTVVVPELESIEIDVANDKIAINDLSTKLTVIPSPATAECEVTWSSSDESVLTVGENGEITPVGLGTAVVTATAVGKPEISATMTIEITEAAKVEITEIKINGEDKMYLGYSIKLQANVYPLNADQSVIWTSVNPTIASVDEDGYVTALKVGSARIKATSSADSTVSAFFIISIEEDTNESTVVDMQGYEIVIYNAESALGDIDPHLDTYNSADKSAKIKAWDEAEKKYHCTVSVKAYPETATWGSARINQINQWATSGTPQADIYTISSAWLSGFVQADSALDITEYYEKYGKSQMEPAQKEMGTIGGKLYTVSTGTSTATNYVDHGLYYNYDKIEEYGLEDPAELFNNGEWTYSKFESWARELQTNLGEGEYALGGHSYYYWLGMSAAAGVKITDGSTKTINIDSIQSKNALALLANLVNAGVMNPNATWAEGDGDTGFQDQTTMMTSGRYYYVYANNRWKESMWGGDEGEKANIGYVPYPYPDNMSKEDTRLAVTGGTLYMYAKGRTYGDGYDAEHVYRVVNDIYLNTLIYTKLVPGYDAKQVLRDTLAKKFNNPESIEAAMFYTAKRVIYDPTEQIVSGENTASSIFNAVTKQVVYDGADYQTAFDAVRTKYEQQVNEKLS